MASDRPSPKKKASRPKKKAAAKKRATPKKRLPAKKNRARTTRREAPAPYWQLVARAAFILLLTLLAGITTLTFLQSISAVKGLSFLTTEPVFFFGMGMVVLPLLVWGFSDQLLYLYVFGHELTHVIFIYLCGGKVFGDIRVSVTGGHVVTNKSNLLISLSPYFVPFYTVLIGTGFLVARLLVDLNATIQLGPLAFKPIYLFYAMIGFSWTMHIYYTLTMLLKDQPDLHMNGTLMSLLVIYLANSIVVTAFVILASSSVTLRSFLTDWSTNLITLWNATLFRIAALVW
jgi:hypothetical protein